MDFNQWFDINDYGHLQAYQHYRATGDWPKGFIPAGTMFNPHWSTIL